MKTLGLIPRVSPRHPGYGPQQSNSARRKHKMIIAHISAYEVNASNAHRNEVFDK